MLSNLFNVFDFTFVLWIAFGAISVVIAMGLMEWFKDLGVPMTWWKWVVLIAWYVAALAALAAPFTFMGEGETGAGGRLIVINIPVLAITGAVVVRVLLLGRNKEAQEVEAEG